MFQFPYVLETLVWETWDNLCADSKFIESALLDWFGNSIAHILFRCMWWHLSGEFITQRRRYKMLSVNWFKHEFLANTNSCSGKNDWRPYWYNLTQKFKMNAIIHLLVRTAENWNKTKIQVYWSICHLVSWGDIITLLWEAKKQQENNSPLLAAMWLLNLWQIVWERITFPTILTHEKKKKALTIQERQHLWQQSMLQRWEKNMSPVVWVTKAEIYQGRAEVGKMISL